MDKKVKSTKEPEQIKALEEERDEYKNKLLRALADYHNLEKRVEEEKREIGKHVAKNVMLRILPFLDNLEQAEIFIKDSGLSMIKKQFIESLTREGLEEINVKNKEFDPHVAEAIEVVDGEKDNVVVEVLRSGYQYKGQILRPAQVKVSKKST